MRAALSIDSCALCPRLCRADRTRQAGFCGCSDTIRVARAALHFWEEPCISGSRGSGTVFFSGCNLRCCFCQNYKISSEGFGREISVQGLAGIFLELQEKGAHNVNLVTATPHLPFVLQALDIAKPFLKIPVVYNSSGYERVETIRELKGYVDIFLPDFKYFSSERSAECSGAADYFQAASAAVSEMTAQTDGIRFGSDGILQSGVIIRHLILPGCRKDSFAVLKWINENLPKEKYLLSLMSQFTPTPDLEGHPKLNRRITTFEYESVVGEAVRLGLTNGYMQERSSAKEDYTPSFDLEGV